MCEWEEWIKSMTTVIKTPHSKNRVYILGILECQETQEISGKNREIQR